ncbi:MAG: hypothetical protein OXP69_24160 [Spirochaetaceae bacterium]|nr:hypothetical protein [Spirochaetaceae bacterium]
MPLRLKGASHCALARPHRDFEDALQRECALANEIGILVTRNTRDHPRDAIQVLTPVDVMRLHCIARVATTEHT